MVSKKLVLTFPPNLLDQPITYQLIKKYDLMVNILRARITPREQGRMVVELSGTAEAVEAGLAYLLEIGVGFQPLAQDVLWREDRCTQCTACTSACPTAALSVSRPDMRLTFDHGKCIACELCVSTCPYHAIEIVS
jgi:L-aspartate semialdehyde sulfurtransferase ferredoxin